jgi:putative restriction endonuclease
MVSLDGLDDEVRALALTFVQRLREQHGGRIPRAALSEGITVRGQRVPIWNYQKGIFKPAVLGRDGAALTVQTSVDSPYDDVHDPGSGRFIYKYRGVDPSHPDNVALRAARWRQKPIIYLVGIDPGFFDAISPVYVADDHPDRLQFTLMADQAGVEPNRAEEPMTQIRRAYYTRAAMARVHQYQFRRQVLRAYREQCAICHLRHVELLDAAHILPDSDPRGEPLISNGLGLCKIHHSAYDANIIGIDPKLKVHVRTDVLEEVDGPMLRYGLQEVNGVELLVPRRDDQKPNPEFLEERFVRFTAA